MAIPSAGLPIAPNSSLLSSGPHLGLQSQTWKWVLVEQGTVWGHGQPIIGFLQSAMFSEQCGSQRNVMFLGHSRL